MALELFRHNEEAYKAVVSMLAERNKAAVVHPTGTGKSFIGFKLCYDNSDKIICWLSPSRYIYQTQLENLKEASGGYEPHNVKFYTYAKLMLLSDENFSEIKPDYIILDEFHRCGAEYWGMGVQKLLEMYPDTPLLGLSATAIRYLDNQRDMTDELFDGNIASEMTLGDAIVRGILDPPKYILSIFSYQKDLDEYEKRVKNARYKSMRDKAEEYLEALRRALDKAEKLFLERPLSKLPELVKYIYLVLTALVIFGGLYFDSFYGYKKWLFALAGVNVKYTLSVSVKSAVLKNITLIVISFFIVCPPAKRAFCKIFKKLSQKSQAAYGRVMITKTIMTVLVFAVSVITLAAEYAA